MPSHRFLTHFAERTALLPLKLYWPSIQYRSFPPMPRRPLTRDVLHEIGTRRRKDPDVQALLWEIRRLRELLAAAAGFSAELGHEQPVHQEYFRGRLQDLLDEERVRFEPKTFRPKPLYGSKEQREPPMGHAQRRIAKYEAEEREKNEREAKRQARRERG